MGVYPPTWYRAYNPMTIHLTRDHEHTLKQPLYRMQEIIIMIIIINKLTEQCSSEYHT